MKDNELVMINVDRINPHPNNPRKDLGDLSELTESIRKQGIMQNLTVIPGRRYSREQFIVMAMGEGVHRSEAAEAYDADPSIGDTGEGYTVLIGHRRLAAAKMAGLTEVPCKVTEGLSEADQLGIMLEENMQRNDLTIIEQAQSFQLMMDLGETEESIAERTGFSKTTVHRRLSISKLDEKKLNDEFFQISFSDLFALEQVKDIEMRNNILNISHSSSDLRWRIQAEVDSELRKTNIKKLRALAKEAGITVLKNGSNAYCSVKYNDIQKINLQSSELPALKKGKKGQKVFMEFTDINAHILVKTEKKNEPISADELKRQDIKKKSQALKDLYKAAFALMRNFILALIDGKIKMPADLNIIPDLWKVMVDSSIWVDYNSLQEFLLNKLPYECSTEERKEATEKAQGFSIEIQMMMILCVKLCNLSPIQFYSSVGVYYEKAAMNKVKDFVEILAGLGFSFPNDEYIRMLYGTHEFYDNGKEEEGEDGQDQRNEGQSRQNEGQNQRNQGQ